MCLGPRLRLHAPPAARGSLASRECLHEGPAGRPACRRPVNTCHGMRTASTKTLPMIMATMNSSHGHGSLSSRGSYPVITLRICFTRFPA